MNLTCTSRELHPRRAFRISRGRRTEVRNVFIRLEHDGLCGYGEASPNAFYRETWESVTAALEKARAFIESLRIQEVADIENSWQKSGRCSLHRGRAMRAGPCPMDWLARKKGRSVTELLWGEKRPAGDQLRDHRPFERRGASREG